MASVKGYFVMGENPVVGSMNGPLHRKGLRDAGLAGGARFPTDRNRRILARRAGDRSAAKCGRRTSAPRSSSSPPRRTPKRTAPSPTRSGCCNGTTRRSSRQAIAAATWISSSSSGQRLKKLYATTPPAAQDRPIRDLTWDYPTEGPPQEPERRSRAAGDQRLHRGRSASWWTGFTIAEGRWLDRVRLLDLFRLFTRTASTRPRARKPHWEQNWVAPEWAWAWPHNRRILYNRASADPEGRPWSERKA